MKKFPEDDLILVAVAEGTCPTCHARLDPELIAMDGWDYPPPDDGVIAKGGCEGCNSMWAVSAEAWWHAPVLLSIAHRAHNGCTCYSMKMRKKQAKYWKSVETDRVDAELISERWAEVPFLEEDIRYERPTN